jgi:periplasmic divalent cation tolerance protein
MGKISVVFVTTDGPKTSKKVSDKLLKGRLAACVNRVPGIVSQYWWKGRLEKSKEELLIIKTKKTNLSRLIREVKRVHPYTVPEVIAVDVAAGNREYLNWVNKETV